MNSVKDLAKKIKRHWTNILNTIEHGLSSAKCESVNNTIKLILRRAYGFRNLQNMTDMIMLCCSDLKVVLPGDVVPAEAGVSGFLCLGRLFQGQPNEAALCI